MNLRDLFPEIPGLLTRDVSLNINITGVVSDSRQVQPGNLFVAFKGENFDGHRFIPQALARGAAAIVGTDPGIQLEVPYLLVSDSRQALPYIAAAYHHFPARQMTMIGVTGTDGKTTTTNLIYQILLAAGLRAGMISTVNAVFGGRVVDTGFHVTTPDAPDVQRYLALMVADGLTHVVLETTSHGWAQHRVDACEFDIGVLTNITHEHINEHGSFENYRDAKARLFDSLALTKSKKRGNPRLAVINQDDPSHDYMVRRLVTPHLSYGLTPASQLYAQNIQHFPEKLQFHVQGSGFDFPVSCRLLGKFNVSNCLAAIGATVAGLNLSPESAQIGISSLPGVPGRMERIDLGQDFLALVDFAHTPNALENALRTGRELARKPGGRVIAIFGSAGLRDKQKRQMMSEVSANYADLTILTAEDPRTELLETILADMAQGLLYRGGVEGQTFWCIPDRGEALRFAVRLAQAGDVLLACGKGHEQSMCFGETEYAWDDRTAMRSALAELLNITGPAMPRLPTS